MKEGHCALMYCKHTGSTWSASHSISKSTVAHINVKFGIGRSSHTIMSFLTSACGCYGGLSTARRVQRNSKSTITSVSSMEVEADNG